MPTRPLPRVATIKHAKPGPSPRSAGSATDRFAGKDGIHKVSDVPSALAYADAAAASTFGKGPAASMSHGPADRFAGHDSRYKRGLRQSTMPIHDPAVYAAKQVDDSVPLPAVAVNVPVVPKREIHPSNERFASTGTDSIYATTAAPAPTKYDPSAHDSKAMSASTSCAASLDKQSTTRFASTDSIYGAAYNGVPKVTHYDPTVSKDMISSVSSSMVLPFESGGDDRFAPGAAGGSIYRKGLRRSTVPEARDTSSFPAQQGINKRANASTRGAALKAALRATIADAAKLGPVDETAESAEMPVELPVEESKENLVEAA
jgi:hypothetical protein